MNTISFSGFAIAVAAAFSMSTAKAQTYPVKPIRIISPYTAGGLGDPVPRTPAIQAGSSANTWLKDKTDPSWVYGYDSTSVPLTEPAAA